MKTQVYDRFGGGLLLLVMLTIAVVAGEAQPDFAAPAPAEHALERDAGLLITINQGRTAGLDALTSVADKAPDLAIEIEVSIEETEANLPDSADPSHLPVQ